MNGWSSKNYALGSDVGGTPVGASATNTPVSKEFPITAGGALNMAIKIVASAATVAVGITAKLQTAVGGDWVDSKTVAIVSTAPAYIKLNVEVTADQTFLPLLNKGRVVITTGAGDSVTISEVDVLQNI